MQIEAGPRSPELTFRCLCRRPNLAETDFDPIPTATCEGELFAISGTHKLFLLLLHQKFKALALERDTMPPMTQWFWMSKGVVHKKVNEIVAGRGYATKNLMTKKKKMQLCNPR